MPALTPDELKAAHEAAQMAIQQHCIDVGELVESIARFIETWGSAPPNPRGRRQELANNVRDKFAPAPPPETIVVKGSEITDSLLEAERECFDQE